MKNELTFLILFLLLAMKVSGQTGRTVYTLHPYTKGNQIDLTVANEARTTSAEQVEVRAIGFPQGITFKNDIQIIESVPPQGEKTVSFTFDVGRPSKIGSNPTQRVESSTDTLKFLVSLPSPKRSFSSAQAGTRSGETWVKSIVVMYALPTTFALEQNYPNPFNPSTVIRYQLPEASRVAIRVYDVLGREVGTLVDEVKDAGYYEAVFDASNLASGVYFYRMNAGNYAAVKKLVVVK